MTIKQAMLTKIQRETYNFIKRKTNGVSSPEIADHFNICRRTAYWRVVQLVELGKVRVAGNKRATVYYAVDTVVNKGKMRV